jgi:hypothetical protein
LLLEKLQLPQLEVSMLQSSQHASGDSVSIIS